MKYDKYAKVLLSTTYFRSTWAFFSKIIEHMHRPKIWRNGGRKIEKETDEVGARYQNLELRF